MFLFLKMILVLRLYKNIQIRAPEPGHVTVKYFIEILKVWVFLKQTLYQICVS